MKGGGLRGADKGVVWMEATDDDDSAGLELETTTREGCGRLDSWGGRERGEPVDERWMMGRVERVRPAGICVRAASALAGL